MKNIKSFCQLALLLSITAIFCCTPNKQPDIEGIDHIGITVPFNDSTEWFYTQVLQCRKISEVTLPEATTATKKKFHIRQETELKKIIVVQSRAGQKIELFEFTSTNQRANQFQDDLNWHHLAFYTHDIKKSIAFLKSYHVQIINPNNEQNKIGKWVYFLTPWNTEMELVEIP